MISAILIVILVNSTGDFEIFSQELPPAVCVAAAEEIAPFVFSAECHGITIGVKT